MVYHAHLHAVTMLKGTLLRLSLVGCFSYTLPTIVDFLPEGRISCQKFSGASREGVQCTCLQMVGHSSSCTLFKRTVRLLCGR